MLNGYIDPQNINASLREELLQRIESIAGPVGPIDLTNPNDPRTKKYLQDVALANLLIRGQVEWSILQQILFIEQQQKEKRELLDEMQKRAEIAAKEFWEQLRSDAEKNSSQNQSGIIFGKDALEGEKKSIEGKLNQLRQKRNILINALHASQIKAANVIKRVSAAWNQRHMQAITTIVNTYAQRAQTFIQNCANPAFLRQVNNYSAQEILYDEKAIQYRDRSREVRFERRLLESEEKQLAQEKEKLSRMQGDLAENQRKLAQKQAEFAQAKRQFAADKASLDNGERDRQERMLLEKEREIEEAKQEIAAGEKAVEQGVQAIMNAEQAQLKLLQDLKQKEDDLAAEKQALAAEKAKLDAAAGPDGEFCERRWVVKDLHGNVVEPAALQAAMQETMSDPGLIAQKDVCRSVISRVVDAQRDVELGMDRVLKDAGDSEEAKKQKTALQAARSQAKKQVASAMVGMGNFLWQLKYQNRICKHFDPDAPEGAESARPLTPGDVAKINKKGSAIVAMQDDETELTHEEDVAGMEESLDAKEEEYQAQQSLKQVDSDIAVEEAKLKLVVMALEATKKHKHAVLFNSSAASAPDAVARKENAVQAAQIPRRKTIT